MFLKDKMSVSIIFKIYHVGNFVRDPKLRYLGRKKYEWLFYDVDRLSYFRIIKKVIALGYGHNPKIYWLPKGKDFDNGLLFVFDDSAIYKMMEIAKEKSKYVFDLYLDHLVDIPTLVSDFPMLIEGKKMESEKKNR